MNTTTTVAKRVADLRARRKAQGLVKVELWVHAKDVGRLKAAAVSMTRIRAFHAKRGLEVPSLEEERAVTEATYRQSDQIKK